jgi:hypothetical protein
MAFIFLPQAHAGPLLVFSPRFSIVAQQRLKLSIFAFFQSLLKIVAFLQSLLKIFAQLVQSLLS